MRLVYALLLIACFPGIVSAAAPQATLKSIQGKVEIKTLNANAWAPAKEGMVIKTMTTISTGFDSSVTLEMDGNSIFVKPLTRMTLDQLVEQQGTVKTSCYLRVGGVKASVKSAEGVKQDFQVQSPYSTASVRGTVFEYDGLKLKVIEGLVALRPGRPKRSIQLPVADVEEDDAEGDEAPANEASGAENAAGEEDGEPEAGLPSEPDLSADFIGSPEIEASGSQDVFVPAGNNAELKIQRGGSTSTTFSGDEAAKKKNSTVSVTDSGTPAAGTLSAPKAGAGSKYGTVVVTVTAPEK